MAATDIQARLIGSQLGVAKGLRPPGRPKKSGTKPVTSHRAASHRAVSTSIVPPLKILRAWAVPPERLTLSVSEVSRLLGLSRKTVRQLARAGRLPVVDLGLSRIMIDRKRLETLLAS